MIILHFTEYASGGIATYLKYLISAQSRLTDVEKIYLLVSNFNSDNDLLKLSSNKLVVIKYKYRRSVKGIFKIWSLSKLIRKLNPDIIHIHSSFAGMIRMKFLFSSFKKRIIYCAHGWSFNQDISLVRKNIYKIMEFFLSFGCEKIINISNYEEINSSFIENNKMITIYNSLPLCDDALPHITHKFNKNSEVLKILFVGRLDKQKGIDLLVRSVNSMDESNSCELTIVGDAVVNPIIEKKNTDNIKFLGWLDKTKVYQAMSEADVLVIPSRWEGFGLVALEAMRAHCLVLASDAGALPEIVLNEDTGFVFHSGSLDSLEYELKQVKSLSPLQKEIMEDKAYRRFEYCFSYNKMLDQIMKLYNLVLNT